MQNFDTALCLPMYIYPLLSKLTMDNSTSQYIVCGMLLNTLTVSATYFDVNVAVAPNN